MTYTGLNSTAYFPEMQKILRVWTLIATKWMENGKGNIWKMLTIYLIPAGHKSLQAATAIALPFVLEYNPSIPQQSPLVQSTVLRQQELRSSFTSHWGDFQHYIPDLLWKKVETAGMPGDGQALPENQQKQTNKRHKNGMVWSNKQRV